MPAVPVALVAGPNPRFTAHQLVELELMAKATGVSMGEYIRVAVAKRIEHDRARPDVQTRLREMAKRVAALTSGID